jgi:hypothetical protein
MPGKVGWGIIAQVAPIVSSSQQVVITHTAISRPSIQHEIAFCMFGGRLKGG